MGDLRKLEENKNFWEKRYETNSLEWHIEDVHPQLVKYLSLLTSSGDVSSSSKKFFLPLCGKTKDIPYLLSLGHEVFGVECVKSAIEQLNEENNLEMKFDEKESLFYTEDKKLQIFVGDFFTFPVERWGPFDAIWDRGSFIALDYPLRESYVKIMQRSVNGSGHPFRYLLQSVRYDRNKNSGPPKSVSQEDISNYFGSWTNVQEIEKYVIPENSPMRKVSKNTEKEFYEVFFLFTNKN